MGLDNYWKLPENVAIEFEPPLNLWGGMLSGHGQGSFRGKVYYSFFINQLDISLYENRSNEEVRDIADRLREIDWNEEFSEEYKAFESKKDLENLKRMFEAYSKAGASLKASY